MPVACGRLSHGLQVLGARTQLSGAGDQQGTRCRSGPVLVYGHRWQVSLSEGHMGRGVALEGAPPL